MDRRCCQSSEENIWGRIRESRGFWQEPEYKDYLEGLGLEQSLTRQALYV